MGLAATKKLKQQLRQAANRKKADILSRFFKTAPGEYGYGDVFLGITVPQQRSIARHFSMLSLPDIRSLLISKIHEERFSAIVILVNQFRAADEKRQKKIYTFYLKHTARINNWDLVDASAPHIMGTYLLTQQRTILYALAASHSLWERRIAIVATLAFIRNNEFSDTLKIAELLLVDKHDLIHKAVGWMLREVGKRSENTLKQFLNQNYHIMPRTMLRYAIERLTPSEQKRYCA